MFVIKLLVGFYLFRLEVRLHRRVARRIRYPYLQVTCIGRAIGRLYMRVVHRERSGKQSLSSWYQSARLITVQLSVAGETVSAGDWSSVDGVEFRGGLLKAASNFCKPGSD